MVFKAKDALTFKIRLSLRGRKPRTVSTGMRDKGAARDVERWVKSKIARGQTAPLVAVLEDRCTLIGVYGADVGGRLDDFMTVLNDTDLEPLVAEWSKRANAKYVRQARALIAEGERFPASRFRRKVISEFLAGLDCADPTKNRYRAALSVFAKWLVEREVIESNPVRDVAMYAERDPRMAWMTWTDAQRVADAAPAPYRELFAVMAGTGVELGAALRLTATDAIRDRVPPKRIVYLHARGSKTAWRNRVVRVEEWSEPYLDRRMARTVGAALLFPGVVYRDALATFKAAQKAVGLSGHRLHDLRHTYAVNALRKGYRPTVVAHQLGHKDATMVTKVYGRFVPDESDYVVTNSVTSAKKPREVKRAK